MRVRAIAAATLCALLVAGCGNLSMASRGQAGPSAPTGPDPTSEETTRSLLMPATVVGTLFPTMKMVEGASGVLKGPGSWSSVASTYPKTCAAIANYGQQLDPSTGGPILWHAYQVYNATWQPQETFVVAGVVTVFKDRASASKEFDELMAAAGKCSSYRTTYTTAQNPINGNSLTKFQDWDVYQNPANSTFILTEKNSTTGRAAFGALAFSLVGDRIVATQLGRYWPKPTEEMFRTLPELQSEAIKYASGLQPS